MKGMTHTDFNFSHMSPAQRLLLAQELIDSVVAETQAEPFTPDQLAELDRRVAALDAGEMSREPWESVRKRLMRK